MRLIFVHGWSVTNTNTYGDLPASLAARAAQRGIDLDIAHIHLGKYISFHDEVTLDDIARALDFALRELPGNGAGIAPFSCITHSTGGPVVRHWINRYYGASGLDKLPLRHLVMLAPANHGSALAVIGKQRIGRLKAWFNGVEPGQRVLDWLMLGSEGQWQLNEDYLRYKPGSHDFYPVVLTGQGIDSKFYDFLNSYLVEDGSDGVVRVSGANMNYRFLNLRQQPEPITPNARIYRLTANKQPVRAAPAMPLGVFHNYSHSGSRMGILTISAKRTNHRRIVDRIVDCLAVQSPQDYRQLGTDLAAETAAEQLVAPKGKDAPIARHSMLVIRVRDQEGNVIQSEDYDIFLLGGANYKEHQLPRGFFVDRQMNRNSDTLVYYLNTDRMHELDKGFGIRVVVRPQEGFAYFDAAEFRSEGIAVEKVFAANETTYVNVTMLRQVDKNVFRFADGTSTAENFKNTRPSREPVT